MPRFIIQYTESFKYEESEWGMDEKAALKAFKGKLEKDMYKPAEKWVDDLDVYPTTVQ